MLENTQGEQLPWFHPELIDYRPAPFVVGELGGLAIGLYGAFANNGTEVIAGFGAAIVIGIIGVVKNSRLDQTQN